MMIYDFRYYETFETSLDLMIQSLFCSGANARLLNEHKLNRFTLPQILFKNQTVIESSHSCAAQHPTQGL